MLRLYVYNEEQLRSWESLEMAEEQEIVVRQLPASKDANIGVEEATALEAGDNQ
jgi:hypothetical protein